MNNRDWGKRFKLFISKLIHKLDKLDKYKACELIIKFIDLLLKFIEIFKKYF